jgi:hypothetical protein
VPAARVDLGEYLQARRGVRLLVNAVPALGRWLDLASEGDERARLGPALVFAAPGTGGELLAIGDRGP